MKHTMTKLQAILLCALICVLLLLCGCSNENNNYKTDSVSDYGIIPGGEYNPNEKMQEAFSRVFPASIEDAFRDVRYHYHAVNLQDEWTAEMYLEFSLDTEEQFQQYVEQIAPLREYTSFANADGWYEYVYNDYYRRREETGSEVRLRGADIEKVLINPTERKVIHVALCAPETAVLSETLTEYFDRFHIDPTRYGIGPDDYETFDKRNYGFVSGTDRGESARLRQAFETVMPKELPANAEVVRYHLKALDCAHSRDQGEILLELQYDDNEQLFRAAESVAPLEKYQKAPQESSLEYVYSDLYRLNEYGEIVEADIEKVILLLNEKRIVYVVLLMKEDSPVPTIEFSSYYNRFHISPETYES